MVLKNPITYDGSLIVSDNYESIPKGHCRRCHQKIQNRYIKKYYRSQYWVTDWVQVLYCYDNGYCEACAKWEEKHPEKNVFLPKLTDTWHKGRQGLEIKEYSDGSVLEELAYDDLPQELKGE